MFSTIHSLDFAGDIFQPELQVETISTRLEPLPAIEFSNALRIAFSLCGWRERTVRFGVSRKRFLPIVQQYRPSSADSRADARHVRKGWSMSSCLQG